MCLSVTTDLLQAYILGILLKYIVCKMHCVFECDNRSPTSIHTPKIYFAFECHNNVNHKLTNKLLQLKMYSKEEKYSGISTLFKIGRELLL